MTGTVKEPDSHDISRIPSLAVGQPDQEPSRWTACVGQTNYRNGLLVLQLAGLLDVTGDKEGAIREYEDLFARFPKSEVAANNLAMLFATARGDAASRISNTTWGWRT